MNLLYSEEMVLSLLPFDESLSERLMLGRIIRDVSRFALVKVDQGSNSLQIHRLVQAVIRSQMTEDEQTDARHELHKILVGARPRQGETDDPANWSTYEVIWPHLGPSVAEECDDARTRQLLIDWVRYQWKVGEFEAGLALAQRLETLWSNQLGVDDQQTSGCPSARPGDRYGRWWTRGSAQSHPVEHSQLVLQILQTRKGRRAFARPRNRARSGFCHESPNLVGEKGQTQQIMPSATPHESDLRLETRCCDGCRNLR